MKPSSRITRILATVAASAALVLASAVPALAVHDVSFRITGFGDQNCRTGSTRLVSNTAAPFNVEVCVELDGAPLADHEMTAMVTHGDGSTEEIPFTTDESGEATVRVTPTSAGTTTVELCDDDGCDYGSVEASFSEPPPPPAVASYTGPSIDVGATEPISDGEDDFIDAYTGSEAEESPGAGYEAADIASFRYLGVSDGKARFEFTTRGDIRALFTDGAPFAQLAVHVETPDGQRYSLWYRYSSLGDDLTDARSDRAKLEGVDLELEDWVDASTGVLSATGVDVPPGSKISFEIWISLEGTSSGFWDTAEGTATPAPTPPETTGAPTETTAGAATSSTGGATTTAGSSGGSTTAGDGGSSGGTTSTAAPSSGGVSDAGRLLLWLFLGAGGILILLFFLWWFGYRRRRYAYRADRWGDMEMVEEEPETTDGGDTDEPLVLEGEPVDLPPGIVEEPDATFEDPCWKQRRALQDAEDRLRALEAEQRTVDPGSETARHLGPAIDHARETVAAAQKAFDECSEAPAPGGADAGSGGGGTPGTVPGPPGVAEGPREFSEDCKEEEAAYAAARRAYDAAAERRERAEADWLEANTARERIEHRAELPLNEPGRVNYPDGPDGDTAFEADTAQYQQDLAAKQEAEVQLDGAISREAAARSERDAAVAAQDAAWDAENEARMALDACLGRSSEATPGGGSTETGDPGGPPGVVQEPSDSDAECADGDSRWLREGPAHRFTVLDGNIRIRISNAPAGWGAWLGANGGPAGVPAAALLGLTADQMEDMLDPLPDNRRVIPRVEIPVKTVTVRCQRKYECRGGRWVKTDLIRKNPTDSDETFEVKGGRPVSTIGNIVAVVQAAQARVEELQEQEQAGKDLSCE